MFKYSCFAQLIPFKSIIFPVCEHECMNKSLPIIEPGYATAVITKSSTGETRPNIVLTLPIKVVCLKTMFSNWSLLSLNLQS